MIHLLATKYQKRIAILLFLFFDLPFVFAPVAYAGIVKAPIPACYYPSRIEAIAPAGFPSEPLAGKLRPFLKKDRLFKADRLSPMDGLSLKERPSRKGGLYSAVKHPEIGGPGQPEMSSFKTVSASNMVNLFSGDFSYNIPLLDVGGYPVNMFYSGGIGMEQEASWVGLGWNINPGNINRNMRGVPDDFDGTDTLVQSQNMKPNKTWGVSVGGDLEGVGIKALSLGANIGMSFNNYLGPALDLGVKGGVSFKVAGKVGGEKSGFDSLSLKLGVSADLNSREGLTLSPTASLTALGFAQNTKFSEGASIATSYNSRSGIKALQISEQSNWSSSEQKKLGEHSYATYGSISQSRFSTTISFARPSYLPSIRMPMTNDAYSGHFQLGGAIFGIYGSIEAEAYQQTSMVTSARIVQRKPMVGYLYYEKAMNNPDMVMDFARFNDREVTPHTPIISAPQYSYDIFSIQGEGTGGSIRAYRNEPGFVRDNYTGSQDKNEGLGVDIGIPGHYGANFNIIKTPSKIGEWSAGNKLHTALKFNGPGSGNWENVYFRNPGEACVLDNAQYNPLGGTDLVRFELSGDAHNPVLEPVLDRFSKAGILTGNVNPVITPGATGRKKRTQVIDFLTARDATLVGLDKKIKCYDNQNILDNATDTLVYTTIDRVGGYRKQNHISQINVTESNGKRYIYGLPVYNIKQKDFTFTVNAASSDLTSPASLDKVAYIPNSDNNPLTNPNINGGAGSRDGYVQITETPAYAHSFLLSGLLSPDYVDVTGDGISEDDLGDAVKFNYTRIKQADGKWAVHGWRSPADPNDNIANFNPGKRTDLKDDKCLVSYGERESWYLHSIESKTMIALFTLEDRLDGKGQVAVAGMSGENARINPADLSIKRLRQIDLYSKSDLKKNGLAKARPIKTVHFVYSYRLCQGTPDNPTGDVTGKGKLTLESVYFTFNGQSRSNKNQYAFSYGSNTSDNPAYAFNASDRWGTYKPISMNPADKVQPNMKNSDYPFTPQEQPATSSPKVALDQNAGAWNLKTIVLPSGGQMEMQYESDDYAYVQNRRAAEMMSIAGFSSSPSGSLSNRLYELAWGSVVENSTVFIRVAQPCASDAEVATRYLQGMDQLALKIAVDMPNGVEYVTCYANITASGRHDANTIWVTLKNVNGISPLSLTAVEYLREQLPAQAFPGYDESGTSGLEQIGSELASMLSSLKDAFKDPVTALRSRGSAQTTELGQSFVRLNDPLGFKYGGGGRVKAVLLKDNWNAMTQQFTSAYTQTYDYTTTEVFNGAARTISSGVASYEPSIGGEENPFQTIVQVADKLPLGPVSYGALEMPVLEAFFPAAGVGYSKVTVRSIPSVTPSGSQQKSRSGIGRQITEFYTAKDYPVYYSQTALDPSTDKGAHDASSLNFFYKYAFDSRTLSQGFLVEVNDMHGKLRSQSSYADNDTTIRVNYTENFYRNTGINGLNETFNTVSSAQGGLISPGNIGIDIELMTDTREFTVNSSSLEIQGQLDLFPVILPFWLPFIWPVTGNSENDYRAVTTTKVINYHAVLDSVVVYDKGSQVSTKNLLYDGETGDVIVNRTNNEYNQPIYNTSYPAWWAYAGMGPAYVNTGVQYAGLTFSDGKLVAGTYDPMLFESGDELYITNPSGNSPCPAPSAALTQLWTLDRNKNNPPFPVGAPNFIFIDSAGNPYTNTASLRILRSGYRNMLDAKVASNTSMVSPIVTTGSIQKLSLGSSSQVTNASAVEFNEKWQTDKDVIRTYTTVFNASTCSNTETPDCNGHLEKGINPYKKGLLGNFRNFRSLVFYANRAETDPTVASNLPANGFLSNFALYWDFNGSNQLVPNTTSSYWIENNRTDRVNARGLELETKNALNIYTSAQYGYNKTLPVAITNNSPYYQMAYEGFEDNGYNQSISNSVVNPCPFRQLDFTGMANSKIVNTDTTNFNAHTGKYALGVNPNSTGTLYLPISASDNLNYNLVFNSSTTQALKDLGINHSISPADGNSIYYNSSAYGSSTTTTLVLNDAYLTSNVGHHFSISWDGYIQIQAKGIYNFTVNVSSNYDLYQVNNFSNGLSVQIFGLDHTLYSNQSASVSASFNQQPSSQGASSNYSVALCPGIYHILGSAGDTYVSSTASDSHDQYEWSCSNCNAPVYQSLTTQNGCTTTVPIAGDPTLLNPVFSLPAGRQMLLSAWVREGQPATSTGVTDTAVTYYKNQIIVNDGSANNTLTPKGPVIEGWQRYEGVFTPAASGTGSLNFVNGGSNTVYFDDIRLLPFNAEMKSYVYDPVNLRLVAELDNNNYATFYEYDEEGTLIRTKAETSKGIKTIRETRSAKQKNILGDQFQNGSSCGGNCVVAVMQTFVNTTTLSYPVGVFNANGKLLGNAANSAQYISLWNTDTADANRGVLSAGTDSLHFRLSLVTGKTMPALIGCRYYQMDLAWNRLDGVRNFNGAYIDFGDGTGMRMGKNYIDTPAIIAPNTTYASAFEGDYGTIETYFVHTYADSSLKTLTFYHNDATESEDLDNLTGGLNGLIHLSNLRGNLPQNTITIGGSCYQIPSMTSLANVPNWNSISTVKYFRLNKGDGINSAKNISYTQDFMKNNKGLLRIYTAAGYRFSGYVDTTFRLSKLKSDWNTYFTDLQQIAINDDHWNREDLSALTHLNFVQVFAVTQNHQDDPNSPLVPIPSTVIDNILNQVAAGAGQTVSNGAIDLESAGTNRTTASDASVNFLKLKGWIIAVNGIQQ